MISDMDTDYKYNALRSSRQIRLLALEPLADDGTIRCSLHLATLPPRRDDTEASLLDYEAVSWTWGDEGSTSRILIKDGQDWQRLSVRSNLIRLLQNFRTTGTSKYLWIDGVSINQDDTNERSKQVAMMADIYGMASKVRIWIGEHADDSKLAFGFIRDKISDLASFEEITTSIAFKPQWTALLALMHRPWFSRRWVIQELSHARAAIIQCEGDIAEWSDFETAVSLFERDAGRISKLFRGDEKAEYDPRFLGEVAATGASRLVREKERLCRRDDNNVIVDYRYYLSDIVTNLVYFEARYPHDMIYAVLSLARDTQGKTKPRLDPVSDSGGLNDDQTSSFTQTKSSHSEQSSEYDMVRIDSRNTSSPADTGAEDNDHLVDEQSLGPRNAREAAMAHSVVEQLRRNRDQARKQRPVFEVDYNQTFFEVCKQFIEFHMKNSHSTHNLDILCLPWAPEPDPDDEAQHLPSWIPTDSQLQFGLRSFRSAPSGKQISRINHDPLIRPTGSSGSLTNRSPYEVWPASQKAQSDEWCFGDPSKPDQKYSLFVTGFELDTIGTAAVYSQAGNIPQEWFVLGAKRALNKRGQRVEGRILPESLWRTLVADRGPDGTNTRPYFAKAFELAVKNGTQDGVETNYLLGRNNQILVEFLTRVQAVIWNRKLFKSATLDKLGLAPRSAKEGDSKSPLPMALQAAKT